MDPKPDKENDEERLTTEIDGEEVRLLVHIERIDDAPPDTRPPSPGRSTPPPDSSTLDE